MTNNAFLTRPARVAVGKEGVEKKMCREGGGERNVRSVSSRGLGLKPGTYRVPGQSQYQHATEFVLTSRLSLPMDRLGELHYHFRDQ